MKVQNINPTNFAGAGIKLNNLNRTTISPSFSLFQDKYISECKNELNPKKSQSLFKKISSAIQKLFKK